MLDLVKQILLHLNSYQYLSKPTGILDMSVRFHVKNHRNKKYALKHGDKSIVLLKCWCYSKYSSNPQRCGVGSIYLLTLLKLCVLVKKKMEYVPNLLSIRIGAIEGAIISSSED